MLAALESAYDAVPRRNLNRVIIKGRATLISNGMSDIPGGGEVAGEPVEHGFLLMLLLFSYYRIISWPLRLVLLRCSKMALPFQYHTSFGGK